MQRLALILLVAPLVAGTAKAEEWPGELWDPAGPAEGQIDLPLPCGGALAFLPVETPVEPENPLSDRQVQLGGANHETGYLDYFRTDFLRGGFTRESQALYYIGKYELTRDQYAAVMGETCPEPSRGGARPQGGVSWFDGIELSRRLSEWLRADAPDALPQEEGTPGFLRLPTEAEWEYAARGGSRVDDPDFRRSLPPMETAIGDYAWHQGPTSANGAYRPIGLKRPNPIGLHGMFGGVEELVLEPFRLNRLGRQHGQVGGFVTRGGSIETPAEELRASLRTEWPFFNIAGGEATAFESFGLRLVISAPVNTSLARTTLIRDRWLAGASAEPGLDSDPLNILDHLAQMQTDVQLLNELAFIRGEIVADRRARQEAAARALRLTVLNGAVLGNWIRQEHQALRRNEQLLQEIDRSLGDERLSEASRPLYEQRRPLIAEQLAQANRNFELSTSAYLTALVDLVETHGAEQIESEAARLLVELEQRGQESLAPAIDRFLRNLNARRDQPSLSREGMIEYVVE